MFKKKDIVEYYNRGKLLIVRRVDRPVYRLREIQYVWTLECGWVSSNVLKLVSGNIGSINILVIREDNDN